MNALTLLALATGLNFAALQAPAANTQAAKARLDTLVEAAAPVVATRGLDAALADGLHRYTEASAAQIAAGRPAAATASVPRATAAKDFAPVARERIDTLVAGAGPRLHRHAVATALNQGADELGRRMDTQIGAARVTAGNTDEVAVVRSPAQKTAAVRPDAP